MHKPRDQWTPEDYRVVTEDARRVSRFKAAEERIKRIVDGWPPLAPAQRERLALLLTRLATMGPPRRRGPGEVTTPRREPKREICHDTDTAIVPHDAGDVAAELAAWGSAVLHLHSLGLPAAVPEFPAAWLRARGFAPTG